MASLRGACVASLLAGMLAGCITVNVPSLTEGLSIPPAPFIVKGTAQAIEESGSCFVWQADDGTVYILFQGSLVLNRDFDSVITPGTRSRLQLKVRYDLGEPCRPGTIAEVTRVLEIEA